MFRSVPHPHYPSQQPQRGVSRHVVERLLAERDALAQDRHALAGEVRRLRQALVQSQSAKEPVTQLEPPPTLGDREQELLADIATLQRNVEHRVAQAVAAERRRVLSVVADCYDDVERAARASADATATGLPSVLQALDDRLGGVGAARVGTTGEAFNPTCHEAIGLDASAADGVVVAVASSGLTDASGQLLRAAKVVVGSGEARTPHTAKHGVLVSSP